MSTDAAVVPRPAATVLLVRDSTDGLQVFLQRRVAGMVFAGGKTVFPGGGVDPADVPDPELWTGPAAEEWGRRFDYEPELAAQLVHAAVRETFEECGVLLAGGVVPPAAALNVDREELVAHRRTLPEVLRAHGLVLRADLLRPWARWVTPPGQPRRYDTAFFLAVVPEGQEADARTTEAVEATWWTPAGALAADGRGEMRLMTPTLHTLTELADHPDTATLLAVADTRPITVVRPAEPAARDRPEAP